MPKKVKKAKTGTKSKAKGKGKKGKKGVKSGERDDILKEAITNAILWENRLSTTQTAKNEYRESTRTLLQENEKLQSQVSQTEKDTIDVISFLKLEDAKKDTQITQLQNIIKELKKEYRQEKQTLITDYSSEIEQLQKNLSEKTGEVKLMQSELKLVKEFRRKRAHMQKELDEIKDNVFHTEKQHKDTLEKIERKFFEEKIRLQEEAGRKISELAERAHTEAVSNLDETTQSIYKENVRLNEALSYHVKVADDLLQVKQKLEEENKSLVSEKEMNGFIVEEKVIHAKKLERHVKELRNKTSELEHTLTQVIKENQTDKVESQKLYLREQELNKIELSRLQRTVELKSKEMNRVKRLAKNILNQRSEVETFFMEALEHVKNEIIQNRSQYRRDAEVAYHQRMLAAHAGVAKYPKIRTFNKVRNSTNSIYADMEEAEKWEGLDTYVDIADLTWEQKERVIRMLFSKLNVHNTSKSVTPSSPKSLPPIKPSCEHHNKEISLLPAHAAAEKATFLTQTFEDVVQNPMLETS